MERYVNVGIDLGMKGQHQAVVVDEHGVEVGERLRFSINKIWFYDFAQ